MAPSVGGMEYRGQRQRADLSVLSRAGKAMIVFVFLFGLALGSDAAAIIQDAKEVSINRFESAEEMTRLKPMDDSAFIEQSTEQATDGKCSIRVTFRSAAQKYSGLRMDVRRADGTPADWSRFRALRLDVRGKPPGGGKWSVRIDFSLKDADGNNWWHRCVLSVSLSEQVLEVPLFTTMDRMSPTQEKPFDFAAVVAVTFYTKQPVEDVVLFFDNMRLAPKNRPKPAEAIAPTTMPERAAPRALGRDFVFTQHYHPDYPYEEKGFFRLGRGPVLLRLSQPGYHSFSADLPELLKQISELRERQIPFHVIVFNFWAGRCESYEEGTTRLREAIAAFQAAGGELFQGVWLHEPAAIPHYRIVSEREGRLAKANAYVEFLGKFITDMGLPPETPVVVVQDRFSNYGLDYEAGADVVLPETLFLLDNMELSMAQARGMARSFGRWFGGDTARYTGGATTARYNRDGSTEPARIDFYWWKIADVYKAFIQHYYSGADVLRGQSEWPARRPGDGLMFDRFLRFVEQNPRADKVISPIAIVRGKGDYWGGANLIAGVGGLGKWRTPTGTKREELDFLYLNVFFPGFSDDGYTAKHYWTGTPYGPIDIIYPSMSLGAMKKYDVLVLMGFHRVDSVRPDFLADLISYVESGGAVLLSADHLRTSDESFGPHAEIKRLAGVEIAEETRRIAGPIRIVEGNCLRFPKPSYNLPPAQEKPVARAVVRGRAVAVAEDAAGVPLLMCNALGRGRVLLLTTPTLSTMPPAGNNDFLCDLVRGVAATARQPVRIRPGCDHVEFIMSKSADGLAVVFLMNHERSPWGGQVIVDLRRAGISAATTPHVSAVVCRGYQSEQPKTSVSLKEGSLVIEGVKLPGGTDQFDPFRAASFAVLTIQNGQAQATSGRKSTQGPTDQQKRNLISMKEWQ